MDVWVGGLVARWVVVVVVITTMATEAGTEWTLELIASFTPPQPPPLGCSVLPASCTHEADLLHSDLQVSYNATMHKAYWTLLHEGEDEREDVIV